MTYYRHVYQGNSGGVTYVPLEINARLIHSATPLLARQVSSKYGEMSSRQVRKDLSENHQRHLSEDYIQKLSFEVGSIIEAKESKWTYCLPEEVVANTHLISIGRDGTTVSIRKPKTKESAGSLKPSNPLKEVNHKQAPQAAKSKSVYREAMNGTISFYDKDQQRLHTIYLAQAPEYGKLNFNERFSREIEKVKDKFTNVTYVGLADGSKDNWTFLEPFVDYSILDFWHVCEYLTKASKAVSRAKNKQKQWLTQARVKLRDAPGAAKELLEEMKQFKEKKTLSNKIREDLQTAITYFINHLHQMDYAKYSEKDYPIGSGVTEAACKVIIKQRTGQSGMMWYIYKVQKVLMIRTLRRTQNRWEQFWKKIDQYGASTG